LAVANTLFQSPVLGRIAEQFGMEIPHENQHPGVSVFLFDRRTAA